MSQIQAFFNARQDNDTNATSIFLGIKGDTASEIIPDVPSFLKEAGRDYGILRTPALVRDPYGGLNEAGEVSEAVREVEGQFHLMRASDGRVVSPHTVTGQYAPLTLLDIAEEVQPWCDAGWVTPDAVYSGKNESLELLCLRMDASGLLPNGEAWEHYIIFRNPHGSGGKARGSIISYRAMCANTFGAVGRGIEFVVGHRISAKMTADERQAEMAGRAKRAIDAWKTAQKYVEDLSKRINNWSSANLSYAQAEKLTDQLLGIVNLDGASARKKNMRTAILDGFSMPQYGTNGTSVYDWLNGVTFVNSSPNSATVKKSNVSSVDRMIRNVHPSGS
jgi:hypothetical protein